MKGVLCEKHRFETRMDARSALGNPDPEPPFSSEIQRRLTSSAHTEGGSPRVSDAVTVAITFLSKSGVGEVGDASIVSSLVDNNIIFPTAQLKIEKDG